MFCSFTLMGALSSDVILWNRSRTSPAAEFTWTPLHSNPWTHPLPSPHIRSPFTLPSGGKQGSLLCFVAPSFAAVLFQSPTKSCVTLHSPHGLQHQFFDAQPLLSKSNTRPIVVGVLVNLAWVSCLASYHFCWSRRPSTEISNRMIWNKNTTNRADELIFMCALQISRVGAIFPQLK